MVPLPAVGGMSVLGQLLDDPVVALGLELVDELAAAGSGDAYVTTLADFAARIRSDHARYGKLIKDIGLAVD